jgi:hypothetical protein
MAGANLFVGSAAAGGVDLFDVVQQLSVRRDVLPPRRHVVMCKSPGALTYDWTKNGGQVTESPVLAAGERAWSAPERTLHVLTFGHSNV